MQDLPIATAQRAATRGNSRRFSETCFGIDSVADPRPQHDPPSCFQNDLTPVSPAVTLH